MIELPVAGDDAQHQEAREQVRRQPEQVEHEIGDPGADLAAEIGDVARDHGPRPAGVVRVVADQDQEQEYRKEADRQPARFLQQAHGALGQRRVARDPARRGIQFEGGRVSTGSHD